MAQQIADHADSRTTKLYDRRDQKVLVEDMERIRYQTAAIGLICPTRRFRMQLTTTMPLPCSPGQSLLDEAAAKGWTVVNMKDNWKSIFPTDRTKPIS